MHSIFVFVALKFDKSSVFIFEQYENIYDISPTLLVLKLDKSKFSKFWQLKNIDLIFTTFEVSKFDISNEVNWKQFWNNDSILVTEEVIILFKLIISVNWLQFSNICDISFAFEQWKLDKSTLVKEFKSWNIQLNLSGGEL